MSAEDRFYRALRAEQESCANPEKMPYLCIAGFADFDELNAEQGAKIMALADAWLAASSDPAKTWSPECTSSLPSFQNTPHDILRVNDTPHPDPQAQNNRHQHPELSQGPADVLGLDNRQLESQTEWFEFCGCKVFRAMSQPRGFVFA